MSESTLGILLVILFTLLILLLASYWLFPDEKPKEKVVSNKKQPEQKPQIDLSKPLSFEQISQIFVDNESSKEEFLAAIEQLIRHHGKIHAKLGDLPHPDFKRYKELIIKLCKNTQADKDVIIALNQKLRALNMKYAFEIDEAVSKGIEGRGF